MLRAAGAAREIRRRERRLVSKHPRREIGKGARDLPWEEMCHEASDILTEMEELVPELQLSSLGWHQV